MFVSWSYRNPRICPGDVPICSSSPSLDGGRHVVDRVWSHVPNHSSLSRPSETLSLRQGSLGQGSVVSPEWDLSDTDPSSLSSGERPIKGRSYLLN